MILFTVDTRRSLYTVRTIADFDRLIEEALDELSLKANRPIDKEDLEVLFYDQSVEISYNVEA